MTAALATDTEDMDLLRDAESLRQQYAERGDVKSVSDLIDVLRSDHIDAFVDTEALSMFSSIRWTRKKVDTR